MKKIFNVKYFSCNNLTNNKHKLSHQYEETWDKQDCFCPNCGQKEVWAEWGPGDYYVGEQYLCTSCNHGFYLPNGTNDGKSNPQDKQRLHYLRFGKVVEPD